MKNEKLICEEKQKEDFNPQPKPSSEEEPKNREQKTK